jgi:hypothetical protein
VVLKVMSVRVKIGTFQLFKGTELHFKECLLQD